MRGLCLLTRKDYRFSLVDLNHLSHPSVEFQAISLYCSLDSLVLIINLYRHPNSRTPSIFYSNLFTATSAYKYSLIIGDFNAHHQVWGDTRVDRQRDAIVRACDSHNLIILNDGLLSSPPRAILVLLLTCLLLLVTLDWLLSLPFRTYTAAIIFRSVFPLRVLLPPCIGSLTDLNYLTSNLLLFIQDLLLKPLDFTL